MGSFPITPSGGKNFPSFRIFTFERFNLLSRKNTFPPLFLLFSPELCYVLFPLLSSNNFPGDKGYFLLPTCEQTFFQFLHRLSFLHAQTPSPPPRFKKLVRRLSLQPPTTRSAPTPFSRATVSSPYHADIVSPLPPYGRQNPFCSASSSYRFFAANPLLALVSHAIPLPSKGEDRPFFYHSSLLLPKEVALSGLLI